MKTRTAHSESPASIARLEDLFWRAAAMSPGERTRYVAAAAADDPCLREKLGRLLEAHEGATRGPLDTPPWLPPGAVEPLYDADLSLLGNQVGHFRVIRLIASGGMGTVYEAVQDQPRRSVALKVMHSGLRSATALRRFQNEADILGHLRHPAIAQVHEAGVYDSNGAPRPYFAMELVNGLSLSDHVEERGLDTRARLELLIEICGGVQHAHEQGVIHRDLKPSNILVDAAGHAKVLDFGIARLTRIVAGSTIPDVQYTTVGADVGRLIGTMPYMSPEQIGGSSSEVDARSDVYALGVICYELLTGWLPHDLQEKSIPEAVRIIREDDPTPMSARRRALRGDLDTIVGKALAKDKQRRYQSAAELAAEIGRYLNDEPVLARAPSVNYRMRKFVRRNRALTVGVSAAFVFMLAGLAGTTWQWRSALQQRALAESRELEADRRLAQLIQEVGGIAAHAAILLEQVPGGAAVREETLTHAMVILNSVLESGNTPSHAVPGTRLALSYTLQRLGEVQFARGRPLEALANYERALELRRTEFAEVGFSRQNPLAIMYAVAVAHWRIAEAHAVMGDFATAMSYLTESVRFMEHNVERSGKAPEWHYHASAHRRVAEALLAMGDAPAAEDAFRHCLDLYNLALYAHVGNYPTQQGHAAALRGVADALNGQGRFVEAAVYAARSIELIEPFAVAAGRAHLWEHTNLCWARLALARAQRGLRQSHDAVESAAAALALARPLSDTDPDDFESHYLLSGAYRELAEAQIAAGAFEQGTAHQDEARRLLETLSQWDCDNWWVRRDLEQLRRIATP